MDFAGDEAQTTATGLAQTHTATVDTPATITFHYWPPDAQIAIRAAANEELQPAIATAPTTTGGIDHGTATITLTPPAIPYPP